jgi:putative membrane protein
MMNDARPNKDLILREKLAIERTNMAIDRTLLAFIRTSLYFTIAGLTINSVVKIRYGQWIEILFLIISAIILGIGIVTFFQQKRKLRQNKIHIGDYKLDWQDDD